MGSSLARAEIRIFLEEWLARIPDFVIPEGAKLEVKVGAAAMMPRLPLVWTPRNAAVGKEPESSASRQLLKR